MMMRRLTAQLPIWARPEHPVLRYEIGKGARPRTASRYLRALGGVLLVGGLLLMGYLIATGLLRTPPGQTPTDALNGVLYFPVLALQLILSISAVTTTSGIVGDEQRRQNWDNLRATPAGAELAMRARWVSVFWRMRGLLILVIVLRIVLIVGILWDLTGFQGRYLDLLINGIVPELSLVVAVLLLSFLMTAALLLPITGVGFDGAAGLLIAALFPGRASGVLAQILYILARVGLTLGLSLLAVRVLEGALLIGDVGAWASVFANGALGDWGLSFLYLGRYGEIWAIIPFGVLMGLALLVFALVQAALADAVLGLAVRRAQRKG
jgi:hypothetical protein